MDFDIPAELEAYLNELDRFIEDEIKPLENENDNIRFFDHRREDARTDWERGGLPTEDWEALLFEARIILFNIIRIYLVYFNNRCSSFFY